MVYEHIKSSWVSFSLLSFEYALVTIVLCILSISFCTANNELTNNFWGIFILPVIEQMLLSFSDSMFEDFATKSKC